MTRGLAAALLLLLAGCSGAPAPPPQKTETAAPERAAPAEPPRRKAEITVERPTPPQPRHAALPPPKRAAPIDDDPAQLNGLDGHRVADLLGSASFVRRDGPAEVWQYRLAACVLDVYLYKEGGALTVAHVDLRRRQRAQETARQCFRDHLAAQRSRGGTS